MSKKPTDVKPAEFIAIGSTKLRTEGLSSCCSSALSLYFAQGGSGHEGATETCLYCGNTMIAREKYWEKR